jgi:hypothetical protein
VTKVAFFQLPNTFLFCNIIVVVGGGRCLLFIVVSLRLVGVVKIRRDGITVLIVYSIYNRYKGN